MKKEKRGGEKKEIRLFCSLLFIKMANLIYRGMGVVNEYMLLIGNFLRIDECM